MRSPQPFNGNEALLLNDPDILWQVQSGTWAVFAIPVRNGIISGQRRHLFTVKVRDILFPTPYFSLSEDNSEFIEWQFLAVSLEPSTLLQIWRDEFILEKESEVFTESFKERTTALETWIHHLSTVPRDLKVPISVPPEGKTYFSLLEGDRFHPPSSSVFWVQVQCGVLQWLSLSEFERTSEQGWFPLAYGWLQAIEAVELQAISTAELPDLEIALDGLAQLQVFVLGWVDRQAKQERQQSLHQFEERRRLNQGAIAQTLHELASVLDSPLPSSSPTTPTSLTKPLTPEEALLAAAGAVGRTLGIPILPPAPSENSQRLRDPLEAIARASGIRMRQISLRDRWWQKDRGALLSYTLEGDRAVALLPLSPTQYELYDPLLQTRIPIDAAIAQTLSSVAYIFYPPLPQNLKAWTLLQFAVRGHEQEVITIGLTGLAVTALGMITPQATAILIDQAIPDADRPLLLQIALGLAVTTFGGALFQLTRGIALMRLETYADTTTQSAIWDRLLNLKPIFFRQYAIGDLSARVSVISQIRQQLGGTVMKTLFSSVFSLLNLGLLFFYSPPLALIACVVALIYIGVTVISGVLTLRQLRPLLEIQGQLFGMMVQLINGVSKFRVAGAESRAFAYWGNQYSHQLKLTLTTQGIEDTLAIINKILPAVTTAILFAFATHLLQQSQLQGGTFSTGLFLAFNTAFGTFVSSATTLSSTIVDAVRILPLWQRAEPILKALPEVNPQQADPGRLSGKIGVDHLIFRYRSDGALTLDDVTLHADSGEFIALVGPSGSGKSTLLRLLLGFDTPESGGIYFDGQDLGGLDVYAVRRQLGVVLQQSRLMAASLFDNIASGALITMDEAWEAARMAGLSEDIEAMPMKMHTVVSEGGTNLSGGQRQRLLIARALALKPKILFFDEATSALDNRTQAIVSQSLDQLKVTRIVVAHRLSTIRNADRIYVLEGGRVVQKGTFDTLANQPGLFSDLIQRQIV
jgi:NHLM bacteriocin system ABC transporter ATP-binding protein